MVATIANTTLRAAAAAMLAIALSACSGSSGGKSSAPAAAPQHTITGNVSSIDNFPMPQLNRTRRIWVYLPAGYAASTARYPVLYMNDGQNVFDAATSYSGEWGVDEAMTQMEKDNPALGAIVVAIENGHMDREDEYVPSKHARQYVDFIVQTLKPYIDSHYRTNPGREHTAIGGASYGATVSLYAGLTRQDVFGMVLAFSNVTNDDNGVMNNVVATAGRKQDMQIYLDIGTLEEAQFPGVVASDQQLYQQLLSVGFSPQHVRFVQDPQGRHHESAWQRRFPAAWRGFWPAQPAR